jgi:hypothetical protein
VLIAAADESGDAQKMGEALVFAVANGTAIRGSAGFTLGVLHSVVPRHPKSITGSRKEPVGVGGRELLARLLVHGDHDKADDLQIAVAGLLVSVGFCGTVQEEHQDEIVGALGVTLGKAKIEVINKFIDAGGRLYEKVPWYDHIVLGGTCSSIPADFVPMFWIAWYMRARTSASVVVADSEVGRIKDKVSETLLLDDIIDAAKIGPNSTLLTMRRDKVRRANAAARRTVAKKKQLPRAAAAGALPLLVYAPKRQALEPVVYVLRYPSDTKMNQRLMDEILQNYSLGSHTHRAVYVGTYDEIDRRVDDRTLLVLTHDDASLANHKTNPIALFFKKVIFHYTNKTEFEAATANYASLRDNLVNNYGYRYEYTKFAFWYEMYKLRVCQLTLPETQTETGVAGVAKASWVNSFTSQAAATKTIGSEQSDESVKTIVNSIAKFHTGAIESGGSKGAILPWYHFVMLYCTSVEDLAAGITKIGDINPKPERVILCGTHEASIRDAEINSYVVDDVSTDAAGISSFVASKTGETRYYKLLVLDVPGTARTRFGEFV